MTPVRVIQTGQFEKRARANRTRLLTNLASASVRPTRVWICSDVGGDIGYPVFQGVESDNPDRIVELAGKQL
jgi:hypothetical protein